MILNGNEVPDLPKCDYPGCNNARTFVSKCNMRSCPEGKQYRKACDRHSGHLCGAEMVW